MNEINRMESYRQIHAVKVDDPKYYQQINLMCCCFNLRKATRAVTQFFDRQLDSTQIRATQFTLLLTLTTSNGKTLTEMAQGLVMDRTTLTRNLKPLEKAGLIIAVSLLDKRMKGYALTEKGHLTIQQGVPLWQKAQEQLVGPLGDARYKHLLSELEFVRALVGSSSQDKIIKPDIK